MNLSFGGKILLVAFFFSVATACFILKLPSVLHNYDKQLHTVFYFCAAGFLNVLFARRQFIVHLLIGCGLYLFGIAIEYIQVYSNRHWHIRHGRYDPEDVQANLVGLIAFSCVWILYLVIFYFTKKQKPASPTISLAGNATPVKAPSTPRYDSVGTLCFGDTNISVASILKKLSAGHSEAEILEMYPDLSVENYRAVFAYMAENLQIKLPTSSR